MTWSAVATEVKNCCMCVLWQSAVESAGMADKNEWNTGRYGIISDECVCRSKDKSQSEF